MAKSSALAVFKTFSSTTSIFARCRKVSGHVRVVTWHKLLIFCAKFLTTSRSSPLTRMEYKAGDLVWAKVKGHPYWPARVNHVPCQRGRKQGKYDVFFYGTHEHAYVLESNLKPYSANNPKYRKPSKRTGFAEGIWEIEEDPNLVITLGKKRALWPFSPQNTPSNKRIKEEIDSDSVSNENRSPSDSPPGRCMFTDITNTSHCQAGMKGDTPLSNEIKEDTPLSNDELENSTPLLEQSTSCGTPPSPIVGTPPYHRALFWKNVHQQNTINSGVKKAVSPSGIRQPPPEDHVLTSSPPPEDHVLTSSPPPDDHVLTSSPPPDDHVLTSSPPPDDHVLTTSKLWVMTQEENQVVPCQEVDYKEMSLYEKFSEESLLYHPTNDKKSSCVKEPSCLPNMECESSGRPTQSSPTQQDDQLNKSSPMEGDDQLLKSSPTEGDDQLLKSSSTKGDDQPPKSSPTEGDDQPPKSSLTQQDDELNQSSPTEDGQPTQSSPTENDDQPTQSSPAEQDDQLNQSSPSEQSDLCPKSNNSTKGFSLTIAEKDLELKEVKVVRVRQALKGVELVKTTTYNLKCALRRMDPNMRQALRYLGDIHDAQLDFDTLKEFPDIVRTIRKLKRYKANERISKKANQIFLKFKGMYIKSVKGKSSKEPVGEPALVHSSSTPVGPPQTDTPPTS